jgi:hypothetical protein
MTAIPLRKATPDELHEQRIQAAYDDWMEYGRERPGLWTRLVDLINQRSPRQVERMEKQRGLR